MEFKLFAIFFAICAVESAKILGVFPTPAVSHFKLGFRLMKELRDQGHDVTVVSPFPQKTPMDNYTDVSVESVTDVLNDFRQSFYSREQMGHIQSFKFVHNMAHKLTEKLLSHENFQELLQSQTSFDVVILEYFLNDATMGIGRIFNAPLILFSTLPSSIFTNDLFVNPAPSSYIPNILSSYSGDMDFIQRFTNNMYNNFDKFYKYFYMMPLHDQLVKTYLSKELNIEDIRQDATLMLLNSHPSISQPVPHTPNMIEIGGFHVGPSNKLSEELQMFMDEADDGVVLFSMGSNLNSSDLDEKKRSAIINAFGKIKQRVIWKFEDGSMDVPSNVKLVKWLPQQDILVHPNTKAFISHGGMLSTIEAIYYGIPVIGIPVYGDQKANVAWAVQNGYAVSVDFKEISEEKLSMALNEILYNPKYGANAKTRSEIMRDQVVNPLSSAVYWIEYVIRHKGADHLQSSGENLIWYKRNMIDIIIVLAVIELVLFIIFYYIIKHVIHLVYKRIKARNTTQHKQYERLGK